MPRVKVFDEDKALQAAMLEFWRSGYEATSIQDLEQAMALKRTSIYNAFGNKRSLFQQALQRYLQNVLARFLAVLEEAQTIREAINGVLNEVINLHFNKSHPGGCM
ncbi:MAG: TetR/AcrR family transcriptional regulator, partial [Halobacteria archaeon]|nr:TetR/AcrR family transcriptional regulator [Halobacteria archaeon]